MKDITAVGTGLLDEIASDGPTKSVNEIFNGTRRRMVVVTLTENAVLSRHHADEPISVMCLAGNATFRAGSDLAESVELAPGSLITLEAGIEHDVTARPHARILVTKFKQQ